ncbi:MAG TPA: FG-GAP-like repeat-containing protein [Kofleriaceae bacterium]
MMANANPQITIRHLSVLLTSTLLACAAPSAGPPSWDEFEAAARREVDGRTIYVVEWDRALTLDQLRDYYAARVAAPGTGTAQQSSTVEQTDDHQNVVWHDGVQRRLTYCIANEFGNNQTRALAELMVATQAWESVTDVNFRYAPEHNASCNNSNPAVSFSVRPWTGGGACSFFPDGDGCVPRTLVIDYNDLDTNPFYAQNAPFVRTVGVYRHELGHILGLRHEQVRKTTSCFEGDSTWLALTPYDQSSVMHYPWCDGSLTSDLSITSLDRKGSQILYPFDFSAVHDSNERIDLNNDGRADVCGRGADGVWCALATATSFGPVTRWDPDFSDANGWASPEYYSTIRFPDVNGDHRADICGRGADGVWCAMSVGIGFATTQRWLNGFTDVSGVGASASYYSTIQFPDLNHDGKADICGRGADGVWCALSTGTSFAAPTRWTTKFGDGDGWAAGPEYWSTIRFPDVNGDGKADICGRGADGMHCALSNGTSFGATSSWASTVSDSAGWAAPEYYHTLRFVDINGDGKADLCGRSALGLRCAMSSGTGFGSFPVLVPEVSDANGWAASPAYYGTFMFGDIDADGRVDVCARGGNGVWCARNLGGTFTAMFLDNASFSDANNWRTGPQYYSTLRLADIDGDGKADLCGRGAEGIYCKRRSAPGLALLDPFSDVNGWAHAEYYTTIHLP